MANTWNDDGVDLPADAALGGGEQLPAVDNGTPVLITTQQLRNYINPGGLPPQTIDHNTSGAVSIDMTLGHNVIIFASANVTDHDWPSDPGFGSVVAILYVNDGTEAITVDLDTGFRTTDGTSLGTETVQPGGELFVSAMGNSESWTSADPFLRDVTNLKEGTAPQPSGASLHGKWHLHQASATTVDIPDTAISGTNGTTGLLIVTGTSGTSGEMNLNTGLMPGWTRIERFVAVGYNGVIDAFKRDMDGTATDFPVVESTVANAIRAVGLVTIEGSSAASLTPANAWTEHASATSFDPASVDVPTANSLVLTVLGGNWGTNVDETLRMWSGPSNMSAVINTGGQHQRPLLVYSAAQPQSGSFDPEPFALTQGGSSAASTRSFIAAPTA